jgi:hypothetical protein
MKNTPTPKPAAAKATSRRPKLSRVTVNELSRRQDDVKGGAMTGPTYECPTTVCHKPY